MNTEAIKNINTRDLIYKWILLFFIFFFTTVSVFARRQFGDINFDQITFFLFTENGLVGTEPSFYYEFISWCLLRPIIFSTIILIIGYGLSRLSLIRKILWPVASNYLLTVLVIITFCKTVIDFDGANFFNRFTQSDILQDYFVEIPTALIDSTDASKHKNLILLYVESLETTYADPKIWGENLNEPLDETFGKTDFGIYQVRGTGWTMAGQVASQCGMPLVPFMKNSMEHRSAPIFSNLNCLGDILKSQSYVQYFYTAPTLAFSGQGKYYYAHGYNQAFGKDELENIGVSAGFETGWDGGVNDDILLEEATKKIVELHSESQKFNVTIMTVDNHASDGFLSPRCETNKLNPQIAKVIKCTNRFISKFIKNLEREGVFENTVLVIMGDHNFMGTIGDQGFGTREIYFNYYGDLSNSSKLYKNKLNHFDVFPTIIQLALGAKLPTAHLGYNIFNSQLNVSTKIESYLNSSNYLAFSDFYKSFWE